MGDANKTHLRYVKELSYAQDPGGVYASAMLTFSSTGPVNNDTVTINGLVYTFKSAAPAIARDVALGATAALSAQNLADAINANQATVGVAYYAATVRHPDVVAIMTTTLILTVQSRVHGMAGNSITLTEASTNVVASGATLAGGAATIYASATELRFNSSSLRHNKVTVVSAEIRPDRTVSDLVKVGIGAAGEVAHELHYGDLNNIMLSGLQGGTFTTVSSVATDWSFAAGGVLTKGASMPAGLTGAKWVKISGFVNPLLNGIKRVMAVGALTLTIEGVTATEGAGPSVTVFVNYVRQGVTLDSYIFEQEDPDAAAVIAILGTVVDTMTLTLEARAKAMIAFGFIAYGGISRTDSVGNAAVQASLNPIYNTTANVGKLLLNGLPPPAAIQRMTLAVNNNIRERLAIAREGTLVPGSGTCEIKGDLTSYFTDKQYYDQFLAHAGPSLELSLLDSAGRLLNFYMPKILFADGSPSVQGLNTDVMMPLTYQAVKGVGIDATSFQLQMDAIQ